MRVDRGNWRGVAIGIGLFTAALSTSAAAAGIVYQSASYTGVDDGEYILTADDSIGAAFTVTRTTTVTGIGAQFGGFPSGTIFGAIVPLASLSAFPAGASTDLAAISVADVVFSVPQGTVDLVEPVSASLAPGSYAVIFGSGQFGATGFAGLGDENNPVGSPTLIRSFFSDGWDTFSDTGVRLVVQGTVPEPSAWAMMLAGFAGVGCMVRRRKNRPAFHAA